MRAGFEEYFDLTETEFKELWGSATFVFDTNALLSLFRDKKSTSDELMKIINSISSRVWVPHQVASEFHRNRSSVIIGNKKIYSPLRNSIEAGRKASLESLEKYISDFKHHPVMSGLEALEFINDSFNSMLKEVDVKENAAPSSEDYLGILINIVGILDKRTGTPYDSEVMEELIKEGQERLSRKEPPGYIDYKEKEGESLDKRLGDYIIWRQIIDHAKQNYRSVIFVTDDVKEDWWRKVKGERIGARLELVREFRQKVGATFYIYTRHAFLERARDYLNVSVSDETIENVRSTVPSKADEAVVSDKSKNVGWGEISTETLFGAISEGGDFVSDIRKKKDTFNRLKRILEEKVRKRDELIGLIAQMNGWLEYSNEKGRNNFENIIAVLTEQRITEAKNEISDIVADIEGLNQRIYRDPDYRGWIQNE
ncbi:PIN domain-containing protein [Azospirillum sp. 11R-A]|uniref:PIN domain-containing protein n=1 Tax=Azospirillum sp. 11R-A TaxID=3111634 RepID=UPI003C2F80D3